MCVETLDIRINLLFFFFWSAHYSRGDIALLNCTAIVNTSNESLSDKNPVSDSVHQQAGPELRDELLKLKGTGEEPVAELDPKEAGLDKVSEYFFLYFFVLYISRIFYM